MVRFVFLSFATVLALGSVCEAQSPYIGTSGGLGVYGFIEKDASIYTTLNRGNFTNVKSLTIKHQVTNPSGQKEVYTQNTINQNGWSCIGDQSQEQLTEAFYPNRTLSSTWSTGSKLVSGVFALNCDDVYSPLGDIGYNSREFNILDVQTQLYPNLSEEVLGDNSKYLVGAFRIDPASKSNILTRLRIINKGTAKEGQTISNEAFKLYYESASLPFEFSGDENFGGILYGNDEGDAIDNNLFQNSNLNIPLNEAVWIYVVMQMDSDYKVGNNEIDNFTISVAITNDGMTIDAGNGQNAAVRIDETNISKDKDILLPLKWISFEGWEYKNSILLRWITSSELNVEYFQIESCLDKTNWVEIGKIYVNGAQSNTYSFEDQRNIRGINYFRILQVDKNAQKSLSKVVAVKKMDRTRFLVYPNNTNSILSVTNEIGERYSGKLVVFDVNGKKYKLDSESDTYLVSNLQPGIYFVAIGDQFLKFIKY